MNREAIYKLLQRPQEFDYEYYLNTEKLLSSQKPFDQLCNQDELQFQIVHQVEELWMKLIAYTLLDIDDCINQYQTLPAITLFKRVHSLQKLMIDQLDVLETMSPKHYQEVRTQLGNGSGQESPGFRALTKMPEFLWRSFNEKYLQQKGLTIDAIYDTQYQHDEAYMLAECLAEYDELFQKFCYHHIQLIYRTIGIDANSLKGRSVDLLNNRMKTRFFPELWQVRSRMTDKWGHQYGNVRDSIKIV